MNNQEKRLDKLASKLCRLLSPRCVVCGRPADDPHHLFKRRIKRLRWDIDNLFSVCRACHTHVEQCGHVEELLLLNVSANEYEQLRQKSLTLSVGLNRLDLDEVEADLKRRIKEVEGK